jgi:hypothetical protein
VVFPSDMLGRKSPIGLEGNAPYEEDLEGNSWNPIEGDLYLEEETCQGGPFMKGGGGGLPPI